VADGAAEGAPRAVRRAIWQIAGFVVGAGLLTLCVWYAVRDPDVDPWSRLRQANPFHVVGLLSCSLVSLVLNATTFWITIRPIRDVGWWNMQRLNVVANALNYAPLRLGLILRVAYHLRVDRLSLLQVGAWFASIALILVMVSGVLFVSALVRPELDLAWVGLSLAGLLVGSAATYAFLAHPLVTRHGRGVDVMLRRPRVLAALVGLRLADVAAFAGRVGFAAHIVELQLPEQSGSYLLTLGLVALLAGLIPIRIGFREALVAMAAAKLGTPDESDGVFALLSLIESAGEAIIYVPLGALGLLWYRSRWARAKRGAAVDPG